MLLLLLLCGISATSTMSNNWLQSVMQLTKWKEGSIDPCLDEVEKQSGKSWSSLDVMKKIEILRCMLTKTKLSKPSDLPTFMLHCDREIASFVAMYGVYFRYDMNLVIECVYERALNYELEDDFSGDPDPMKFDGFEVVSWKKKQK